MSKGKPASMPRTDAEYQRWIAARLEQLRHRLTLMEQAASGEAVYRKVQVKTYTVREHEVSSHSRFYLVKRMGTPVAFTPAKKKG